MLSKQGTLSAAVSRLFVAVHTALPALPLSLPLPISLRSDGQRAMCLCCHLQAALRCPVPDGACRDGNLHLGAEGPV